MPSTCTPGSHHSPADVSMDVYHMRDMNDNVMVGKLFPIALFSPVQHFLPLNRSIVIHTMSILIYMLHITLYILHFWSDAKLHFVALRLYVRNDRKAKSNLLYP